jgi:hypothetical protein
MKIGILGKASSGLWEAISTPSYPPDIANPNRELPAHMSPNPFASSLMSNERGVFGTARQIVYDEIN